MKKRLIWILDDGRTGSVNQLRGITQSMQQQKPGQFIVEEKKVHFPVKMAISNPLRYLWHRLMGMDDSQEKWSLRRVAKKPDFIFAAGRRTAELARLLKHRQAPEARLINLMSTGFMSTRDFALIAIPAHDRWVIPSKKKVRFVTTPHVLRPLKAAAARGPIKKPFIAVLLGGKAGRADFTLEHARIFDEQLINFARRNRLNIALSDSRRTSPQVRSFFAFRPVRLPKELDYYSYSVESLDKNPLPFFLHEASAFIVSVDSMSMISEALSQHRPLFILNEKGMGKDKHRAFAAHLIAEKRAMLWTADAHLAAPLRVTENASITLAKEILTRWGEA